MITEAHVEWFTASLSWERVGGPTRPTMTIPAAVEDAREHVSIARRLFREDKPIRVVDSTGAAVAQWGKP